jgi:hypothetical protein
MALSLRALFAVALSLASVSVPKESAAGELDDLTLRVEHMRIQTAQVGGTEVEIDFLRTTVGLEVGFGPTAVGWIYQDARNGDPDHPAKDQTGMMLTARYDWVLNARWQLESFARLAVPGDDDESQPLYATDTDLMLKLIRSSPEGVASWRGSPVHPSASIGTIINEYGRVQLLAAAGLWWRGFGTYISGFSALNGVENPMDPGNDAEIAFANLQNRGITASLSYEFLGWEVALRRNTGITNSGNDWTIAMSYRALFGDGEWRP